MKLQQEHKYKDPEQFNNRLNDHSEEEATDFVIKNYLVELDDSEDKVSISLTKEKIQRLKNLCNVVDTSPDSAQLIIARIKEYFRKTFRNSIITCGTWSKHKKSIPNYKNKS